MKVRVGIFVLILLVIFLPNTAAIDEPGSICRSTIGLSSDVRCQGDDLASWRCDGSGSDIYCTDFGTNLKCAELDGYDLKLVYCIDQDTGCIQDSDCTQNQICNSEFLCEDDPYLPDESYLCSVNNFNETLGWNNAECIDEFTCQGIAQESGTSEFRTCVSGKTCAMLENQAFCISATNGCTVNDDCSGSEVCKLDNLTCVPKNSIDFETCTADWQCLETQYCNEGSCVQGQNILGISTSGDVCSRHSQCEGLCTDGECVAADGGVFPNQKLFITYSQQRQAWPVYHRLYPRDGNGIHTLAGTTIWNARNNNCEDGDSNRGAWGICRDNIRFSYWAKVGENSDPFQLKKLGSLDDRSGIYIYDQFDRVVFWKEPGFNVVYTQEIDLSPGWYHIIVTLGDTGGDVAEFRLGYAKELNRMFESYGSNKLWVDSGNFLNTAGNPVEVRANQTETTTFGNKAVGLSFWLDAGIWTQLDLPNGNWKNVVVSCSTWQPSYDLSQLDNNKLWVKSNHFYDWPVLCNAFVWSEELEIEDRDGIRFVSSTVTGTGNKDSGYKVVPNEIDVNTAVFSCSNDRGYYDFFNNNELRVWKREATSGDNCGLIYSDKPENIAIQIPGGLVQMQKITLTNTNTYDGEVTKNFEFPILGAVVRCDDTRHPRIKNRYGYGYDQGDQIFVASAWQDQECTVIAWGNVCTSCQRGDDCSLYGEGAIVSTGDGNELACLHDGQVFWPIWTDAQEAKSTLYTVPHDKAITEGRNDVTSDGLEFYQCGVSIAFGETLVVTTGGEAGVGGENPGSAYELIDEWYDPFESCVVNADEDHLGYTGGTNSQYQNADTCDESINSCTGLIIFREPQPNEDRVCCVTNNPVVCQETVSCAELGGVELEPNQGCSMDEPLQTTGNTVCCNPDFVEELTSIVESDPIYCQDTSNNGILYQCLTSRDWTDPTEYKLSRGMSTTRISNFAPTEDSLEPLTFRVSNLVPVPGTLDPVEFLEKKITYNKSLLSRTDWTGAEYLDFYLETSIENATYFYVKIFPNIWHPLVDANLFLEGTVPGEPIKVRIPLTRYDLDLEEVDYSNIETIALGTHNQLGGFPNLWATFGNLQLVQDNSMFCASDQLLVNNQEILTAKFIDDMDSDGTNDILLARSACMGKDMPLSSLNPLKWTGTKCCGDDLLLVGDVNSPNVVNQNLIRNWDFNTDESWILEKDGVLAQPFISSGSLIFPSSFTGAGNHWATYWVDSEIRSSTVTVKLDYWSISADLEVELFYEYSSGQILSITQQAPSGFSPQTFTIYYNVPLPQDVTRLGLKILRDKKISPTTIRSVEMKALVSGENSANKVLQREFYPDAQGCFDGNLIDENENVGLKIGDIDKYDVAFVRDKLSPVGEYLHCDFYQNDSNKYDSYNITDNDGIMTLSGLVRDDELITCQTINNLTCTGLGWYDENLRVTFTLKEDIVGGTTGKSYYCEQGTLKESTQKYDWLYNQTRQCHQDSCACPIDYPECKDLHTRQLAANECAFNNTYSGNRFCLNGDWTTRTAFIARQIIENTGVGESSDGTLSCGSAEDVLNNKRTDYFDSACVYHDFSNPSKVIVGIPLQPGTLRQFLDEEVKPEFEDLVEGGGWNTSTCNKNLDDGISDSAPDGIGECNNNITLYFDDRLDIVYIATDDFMTVSFWDGFIDWFTDIFRGGGTLETSFEKIYIFKDGNKEVYGTGQTFTHPINKELITTYRIIYKLGSDNQELNAYLQQFDGLQIVEQGDELNVTIQDGNKKMWNSLTVASRINPR